MSDTPPRLPAPSRRSPSTIGRALVALVTMAALLGSCSGDRPTIEAKAPGSSAAVDGSGTSGSTTTTTPLTDLPAGPANMLGYIATPSGDPQVHVAPDAGSETVEVGATTEVGAPTTFAVIGDPNTSSAANAGWIKILMPIRPNGGTAWVSASSVEITKTPMRMFVDLGARSLRVESDGSTVLEATVAVGTSDNPTPVGPSYVTELIENVNPGGAYGPYAFGLALHSETLTEFAGGPGQVGVHGTNQPQLIGQPVSHGCVRLNNDDIQKLVDLQVPLGLPVFIS